MRLFKKLGLFGFMTLLVAGFSSAIGFSVSNETHYTAENNVKTVANAQHFFGNQPRAAATIDPTEKQHVLDNYIKCEYSKLAYSDLSVYVTAKITTESNDIFSIGYYDSTVAENYIPAVIELRVQDANGNPVDGVFSGKLEKSTKGAFNNLSNRHQTSVNLEMSIDIPVNTTVIEDSVVLKNIFAVTSTNTDAGRVEEVNLEHNFSKAVLKRKSLQTTTFDTFGTFTPKSVTEYAGYYAVAFNFKNVLSVDDYLEINKYLNPIFSSGTSNKNVENLKSGKTYVSIRIILTLKTSFYQIEDLDGKTHTLPVFPANYTTTEGDNNVVFNFPSEGINGVKNFTLTKPMLTVSVINKETNKEVASSDFSYRFGNVSTGIAEIKDLNGTVVEEGKTPSTMNSDVITIIIFAVITVLTLAGAFGLYYYRKIKYANDEFKKVNKVAHIKTSIIAYIFFVAAGLDIYYLIMRTGPINNCEMFANPVDIMVIVFTLVAFLLGCFFIRKYYISFKETLERNRRIKLNMVNEVDDNSGTISAQAVKKQTEKAEDTKDNNN